MKLVISGASGKTGYRIAEEAVKAGHKVRLLVRSNSKLPEN
ncbi:MAG: NAD(P)H-binding protein, partial [Prochlorococcus sp.]